MDIANLIIRVTNDGLDRATRELRRLQDQAQNAQTASEKFGESIAGLNRLALVGMGALAATIGGSIKTAIDFEKAMAGVAKTIDFEAPDGLANMKKGIEDLTKVIPLAFEELAEIAAVGGQLGVAEQDILGFTETIAKMGVAFDIPAEQAADSMAKIAGAFKIPIADIGTLGDSINTVSNSMAATAGDIIGFLSRVGGTSAALKISADNATALGGAMVALGLQPEVAATAFNSLAVTLARFDNLNKTQASGFAKLGLDTKEFAELAKTDGVGAITAVLEATNKLSSTDGLSALSDAFGVEAGVKIATMATGIDTVKFALDQVGVGADGLSKTLGSMDKEFASASATTANKIEIIQNKIRLVAGAVGEAFLPAMNDLLNSIAPVVEKMAAWAKENPELIVTIAKVAAGVLGAIIAIAAINGAVGTVITAFTGLVSMFKVASAGIMLLGSPIGLAVLAIGILIAAGALLYQNWDLVKEKASQLASWLDGVFSGLPAPVQAALSTMATIVSSSMDAIFAVVQFVMDSVTAIWNGDWSALGGIAKTALSAIWSSVSTILGSVLNTVKVILGSLWGVFTSILSSIWQGVVSRFNAIKDHVFTVLDVLKIQVKARFEYIKNTIITTLKELPSKLLQVGKDIVQGLINGIKSGASGVASAIGNVASSAIAKAKSVLDIHSPSRKMKTIGEQTAQGMAVGIKKGKKAVVSEAQKMAADAIKATQDAIAGIDKELALFGNTSKVADIKYDISVGKFGGNTGTLIAKATELESAKKMADIQSQLAAYSKMIYDNSTYLPSELTKISFELDEVEGKFYGASEASKELLRTGAALADQSKAEGVATGMMIDNLRELALLQTDGSDYAKLAYDLQDVSNALYVLDEATKQRLLTDELAIKAAKQTKASNEAITTSIESLDKQIALFGNNDAVEELLYDMVELGKYAGASADNINKLFVATEKLAALNAEKAFKGVLNDNADDKSPIGKIMQEYDDKLAIIKAYEDSHTALLQESVAARLEVEGAYNDARSIMMLSSGEAVFGSLSGLAKNFLGEQSGTYKAMYALQKAFTLSSAIMSSKKAVMDAWANTPGGVWAKAFAAGKVILSTGAITKAIAGLAPQGFKQGGYTGSMGVNDVAGVVHGQEYVFDAQATKRIGVDNLNAMRRGEAPKGGDVQVNIINNSSARVEASNDGKTITISDVNNAVDRKFDSLSNPNSHASKAISRNLNATRRR